MLLPTVDLPILAFVYDLCMDFVFEPACPIIKFTFLLSLLGCFWILSLHAPTTNHNPYNCRPRRSTNWVPKLLHRAFFLFYYFENYFKKLQNYIILLSFKNVIIMNTKYILMHKSTWCSCSHSSILQSKWFYQLLLSYFKDTMLHTIIWPFIRI